MSQASEYAANVSRILQQKADAQAQGHLQRGQILGQTIATLGQVIPQQVQQAMKLGAEKRKKEQIEGIFKKYPGDLDSAIKEIMPIDQKLGAELMDRNVQAQKLAFEYKKAKRDADLVDRKFIASTLGAARDQDGHTQGLLTLQHAGLDISKFNPEFDPKAAEQYMRSAMDPEKLYELDHPPKKPTGGQWIDTVGPDGKPGKKYVEDQPGAFVEAPPKSATTGDVNAGSFEDYVIRYAADKGTTVDKLTSKDIEDARKRYQQADDRPIHISTGEGAPIWAKDPTTGVVRLMSKAEAQRIGASQPDTADMRNKEANRAVSGRGIQKVKELGTDIFKYVGPAQRASAIKRGAEAVFGSDPKFRTYQDARMATAGALAVEQQGSRVSDADVKALWLPLIPDAYRDTKESYQLKWEIIDAMRGGGTETPKAPPPPPGARPKPRVDPFAPKK